MLNFVRHCCSFVSRIIVYLVKRFVRVYLKNRNGKLWSNYFIKVKFSLEQAMKFQRGSRGIALLFL